MGEAIITFNELVEFPNTHWHRRYAILLLLRDKGAPIEGVFDLKPSDSYLFTREEDAESKSIKYTWKHV